MKFETFLISIILFAGIIIALGINMGEIKISSASSLNVTAIVPGVCGNDIKEINEQCDGSDLGENSCQTFGYSDGELSCHTDCLSFITTSCSGTTSSPPSSGGGGGGGGGGGTSSDGSGISLSGRAYPGSVVTLLKDARIAGTTVSDPAGRFQVSLSNLKTGNYIFSLYSEDQYGNRSSLSSFPVSATPSYVSSLTGVFLSPVITVDKKVVKKGDVIKFFGQSAPNSEIIISVHSDEEIYLKAKSDNYGVYLYNFESSPLAIGDHSAKSRASLDDELSPLSQPALFKVGNENIYIESKDVKCQISDVNCNGRVDLVDFSILSYWFKRPNPPENIDLNKDGQVDLIDFSIMAYNWTG